MLLRYLLGTMLMFPTPALAAERVVEAQPLGIGETFELPSAVLVETRRINVYRAAAWDTAPDAALPVLYMPDGGIGEDFLHVAGLLQVSVGNGTMRPFLLVGIENTQRRRDLTGPTEAPEDRKIAPIVGGSAAFRSFLRDELMPDIGRRYRTTDESAIVGESLAGLFVVETFVLEPALFDTYIALDPSLWWNHAGLLRQAERALADRRDLHVTLYLANSQDDTDGLTGQLSQQLTKAAVPGLVLHYAPMPEETHATIYHPAALRAFRTVFAPAGKKPPETGSLDRKRGRSKTGSENISVWNGNVKRGRSLRFPHEYSFDAPCRGGSGDGLRRVSRSARSKRTDQRGPGVIELT